MSSRKTYITPPVDADSIQGVPVSDEAPQDGEGLIYNAATGRYEPYPAAGGGGGGASVSASYVTLATDIGLTSERVLTAGAGISITDNGAGSTVVIATTGEATGADYQASFVVVGVTSSLPNERALAAGTGLRLTDGGAGGSITLGINDGIVATVSGTTFTGAITAQVTGSLTRTSAGTPFITAPAGNIISVTTGANGQIVLSGTGGAGGGGSGAPTEAQYLVLGLHSGLSDERNFTPSTGLKGVDGGPGGAYTLSVHDGTFAALSGAQFTGVASFSAGLSGSLTRLTNGQTYLAAGDNITITSASNGQVTVGATGLAPNSAQYVVLGLHGGLSDERNLTLSTGLKGVDGGPGGNYTISVHDGTFATISGSTFTGPINAQVTGSLTRTAAGTPFITVPAGQALSVSTGSNGQVVLSVNLGDYAPLAGATFTGPISAQVTGSLTQTSAGTPFITAPAGNVITVTTGANGQIVLSGTGGGAGGGAPTGAPYVVLSLDGTLTDERVLTAGNGLKLADGGAGGNATLTIHDSVVATVSGTRFTGVTYHSAGLESTFARLGGGDALAGELRLPGGINGWSFRQRNSISTGYDRFPMYGYEESGEAILGIGHDWTGPVTVGSYTRTYIGGNVEVSQFITVTSSLGNTLGTTLTYWTGSNMRAFMTDGESGNPVNFGIMGFRSALDNPNHAFGGGKGVFYFGQAANYPSSSPTQGVVLWVDSGSYDLHYRRPNGTIVDVLQDSGQPSDYASLTGSTFTGVTNHNAGLSGSLTRLTDGRSFIVAGANVTVASESNGQITIAAGAAAGAPTNAQYLVLSADGTLTDERVLTAGIGIKTTDAGAGGAYTLSVHDGTFAALSGANFTGPVTFNGALTGSLTKLVSGAPFITSLPGNVITITTSSEGQIILSGTGGGPAGPPGDPPPGFDDITPNEIRKDSYGRLEFYLTSSLGGVGTVTAVPASRGTITHATHQLFITGGAHQWLNPNTLTASMVVTCSTAGAIPRDHMTIFVADTNYTLTVSNGGAALGTIFSSSIAGTVQRAAWDIVYDGANWVLGSVTRMG